MNASSLADLVVAFDVDNTLYDPEPDVYRRVVSEFLSLVDVGLAASEAFERFGALRKSGGALERIGLGNPIHDRGNPEVLAVFCLTCSTRDSLRSDLGIESERQALYRRLLGRVTGLHERTRIGSFPARLGAEIEVRRFQDSSQELRAFLGEVERLAGHPLIRDWSARYEEIERKQPIARHRPVLVELVKRGATIVVISQGFYEVQREKLERLEIADLFAGRMLVTDRATRLAGFDHLLGRVDDLIGEAARSGGLNVDSELDQLWHFLSIINLWSRKTPWFYGRCLHAIRHDPVRPEEALADLVWVPAERWEADPLRFVMVGDRYDKEVLPLIELLGRDVGMTLRLTQGKYGHEDPYDRLPPDRRPARTFEHWDELGAFLVHDLSAETVRPVERPPAILPMSQVRMELMDWALRCEFEAVRSIAKTVKQLVESKSFA
jgi:FMN phosphatase YigB (HAD superfamily)